MLILNAAPLEAFGVGTYFFRKAKKNASSNPKCVKILE
ncbi:putative ORFan [Tupanvirus deep ocean]|uniref:ORFan n=2 Tax=Tupanvirus TaxID=2094720 RepID=A0AC62A7R3_9VIRU|nr:putative ORFan [Tupanvirus deep ocean]QKU33718.1 putative ORFan [Tupanvirus deep ocean]